MKKEEKELYQVPLTEVVTVRTEGVICASQGGASSDPFDYGEDVPLP